MAGDSRSSAAVLHESPEQVRLAVEASQLGLWEWDRETGAMRRSARCAEMLGCAPDELAATLDEWRSRVHPEDLELAEAAFRAHVEGRAPLFEAEYRLRGRDGVERWIRDRGQVVERDARGRPTRVSGTSLDVTEHKRLAGALEESEEIFRLLMRHSPTHVFVRDEHGRALRLSDNYGEALGRPTRELLGQTPHEMFPPEVAKRIVEEDRRVLAEGQGIEFEEEFAGRTYLSFKFPIPRRAGPALLGGFSIDVTERRRADRALRESAQALGRSQAHAHVGHWIWDLRSNAVTLSDELQRIYGMQPGSFSGTLAEIIERAVHPDDRAIVRTVCARMAETYAPDSREFRVVWPDGSVRQVWARSGDPVVDDEGRLVALSGIVQDVTERRQAEQELARSRESLERGLAQLQRHARDIAGLHELAELMHLSETVEEAYALVASSLPRLFPGAVGLLAVAATGSPELTVVADWGRAAVVRTFAVDECWAARRRGLHTVGPGQQLPGCRHVARPGQATSICLPTLVRGEVTGVIHLQHEDGAPFEPAAVQLAQAVADTVALALANLQLRESLRQLAIRDPLTTLFNRRYMEETLERELRRAARSSYPLGVVMFDIDHFKSVNDRFGHAAGDAVLRDLGQLVLGSIRGDDVACRYGGEEFVLILPEAGSETVVQRVDQLRQRISELQWSLGSELDMRVTVSCGVAVFPGNGATGDELLRASDAALYRAKERGRNRVVCVS